MTAARARWLVGLRMKSATPASRACCSLKLSRKPVHRATGMSGRTSWIRWASRTPDIWGMIWSVITMSNRPGVCEKSASALRLSRWMTTR